MKPLLQSTASECGNTCLRMIAQAHGLILDDVGGLRAASQRGATLAQLVNAAGEVGLAARPLRLELDELSQLKTPCVLHWDMNHFVVLARMKGRTAVILDPAVGERRLKLDEVSRHFTGVALELTPRADFQARREVPRVSLAALTGRVQGLRVALLQILLVALALLAFAILAPLANQVVIDQVLTTGDQDLLDVVVLGFALLLVVQVALGLARSWMVLVLSQSLALQWSGNVFAHLLRLPLRYFEQRHLGDISSRFGSVAAIQGTLTTAAIEAVLDGLLAIATLAMMLWYAPALTGVVLAAVLAYGLLRALMYRPLRDAAAERLVMAAKENTHFLETLRSMLPLKLFGREEQRHARWQNLVVDVQNRDVRTARLGMAFTAANAAIFGVENLLVLWLGAQLVMRPSPAGEAGAGFTVGMLMAFISYKAQFTGRVSSLIDYAVRFRMLGLHQERLADVVLEPPEAAAPAPTPAADLSHLPPSIELRGVSFRYGPGEPWLLRGVNLRIQPGQSVALVGASGAGKTTLLKILLGLLVPEEGEVLYGGVPLQRLGLANVRRCIGTVMQDDVLLSGSIGDNIGFFDVAPDLARIEACARLAGVHDDIMRMPMGYHTLAGDLGSSLSGGQRQRLLLARALYKQPRVLALDEATSHLDLKLEAAVSHRIAQMRLTRIIVAHRPQTVAHCDGLVLVEQGRVVAVRQPAPACGLREALA